MIAGTVGVFQKGTPTNVAEEALGAVRRLPRQTLSNATRVWQSVNAGQRETATAV